MCRSSQNVLRLCVWACFVCVPVLCPAATAVAFSNFGPSFSYDIADGNVIGNDGTGDGAAFAQADTFTSSLTGNLLSLQIALSCENSCPNSFQISLTQDNSGQPGAVIEGFTYAGPLGTFGSSNTPVLLTSLLHPVLTVGTAYWVEVQPDSSGVDSIAWNWNNTGDSSSEAISIDGGASWFAPSGPNARCLPGERHGSRASAPWDCFWAVDYCWVCSGRSSAWRRESISR